MKPLQEMVLISEIVLQSEIAQRAAERLHATHDNFDKVEVWCSIQSILVATGNVSKILWPSRKEYKSRGEKLRKMLNVDEHNLLSDRKFRNSFEHYDELIDDWFNNQSRTVYTDLSMNPSLRGPMSTNDHRGYNSFNNTLIIRGELLDLEKVLNALNEIRHSCSHYVLS
jgi:hypothetical protein